MEQCFSLLFFTRGRRFIVFDGSLSTAFVPFTSFTIIWGLHLTSDDLAPVILHVLAFVFFIRSS